MGGVGLSALKGVTQAHEVLQDIGTDEASLVLVRRGERSLNPESREGGQVVLTVEAKVVLLVMSEVGGHGQICFLFAVVLDFFLHNTTFLR